MTLSGTINKKHFYYFLLLTASAMVIWWMAFNGYNPIIPAIGGAIWLILVVISAFKPQYSPYLAPGYALFEGLFMVVSPLF
jgi:uncharacterized YccA/Bax inhibitor family protein